MCKNLILVFLLLAASTACRQTPPEVSSETSTKPAARVSPPVSSNESVSAPPTAKYYDGRGTVTKINLEIGSVELDHEEIKGLMPKMIMEFYVSDKSQLKDLKIGDRADFVVEDKGGAEKIVDLKKRQ